MNFKKIIIFIICSFAGYSIGRFSHILGGSLVSPHHWIYGFLIFCLGWFLKKKKIGNLLVFFGIGVFISDLNDFFHLRFYGADILNKFTFWGIN